MLREPHSVLILEDEGIVSLVLEEMVRDLGARSIDVFAEAGKAAEAAASTPYDVAILDVMLRDGSSTGVADVLEERGIPFLFASAVEPGAIDERHRSRRLVSKPFAEAELRSQILSLLAQP